ncbi:hypothetical protein SDC9_49246 [bioreactor metagenome]|uniref:HTH cro/C1-type domain-containing protein n=1 Tax=bioreactor metagenome TaxID=1076179 RepID=A0A644WHD1_9ZZZZ
MIERIQLLMKIYQLSAADLADKLGTERSGISHFLSGRNKPSLAFITKLLEKFPEINPDWLLLGTGPTMRDESSIPVIEQKPVQQEVVQMNAGLTFSTVEPSANDQFTVKQDDNTKSKTIPPEKTAAEEVKKVPDPVSETTNPEIERIVIFFNDHSFKEYKMR